MRTGTKRPRALPEGAVEIRIRLIRNAEGALEVDPKRFKVRPDVSRQVFEEALGAASKWLKFASTRMKIDRTVAPHVAEALENAGTRLTQVAIGAVFDRVFGNRQTK